MHLRVSENNRANKKERKKEISVSKHQTIIKVLKLVFMFVTVATLKELSQDLRGEWDAVVGWLRAGR